MQLTARGAELRQVVDRYYLCRLCSIGSTLASENCTCAASVAASSHKTALVYLGRCPCRTQKLLRWEVPQTLGAAAATEACL